MEHRVVALASTVTQCRVLAGVHWGTLAAAFQVKETLAEQQPTALSALAVAVAEPEGLDLTRFSNTSAETAVSESRLR
jgi:hypothetical protein